MGSNWQVDSYASQRSVYYILSIICKHADWVIIVEVYMDTHVFQWLTLHHISAWIGSLQWSKFDFVSFNFVGAKQKVEQYGLMRWLKESTLVVREIKLTFQMPMK